MKALLKNRILINEFSLSVIPFLLLTLNLFNALHTSAGYDFGFEYGNVAFSLFNGNGFGNPFSTCQSGPTAWVPPLLAVKYAIVFHFFSISKTSFIILNLLNFLYIAVASFIILTIIYSKTRSNVKLVIFTAIFCFYLFSAKDTITPSASDIGLSTLVISLLIFLGTKLISKETIHWKWHVFLFIVPFTSSFVLIPLFTLFLVVLFYRTRGILFGNSMNTILNTLLTEIWTLSKLGLPVVLAVGLWGYRNYKALGEFIPLKSNLWFEFYQANVISPTGYATRSVYMLDHPNENKTICEEISKAGGEAKWVEKYKQISKQYIENHKNEYFHNVLKRAFFAFIFTQFPHDIMGSPFLDQLDSATLGELTKLNLIRNGKWISLLYPEEHIKSILQKNFPDKRLVFFEDWQKTYQQYLKNNLSPKKLFKGVLLSFVPFFFSIWLIVFNRKNKLAIMLVIFYFSYQLLFVFVSHTFRYQNILIILDSLLIFWAINLRIESRQVNTNKESMSLR